MYGEIEPNRGMFGLSAKWILFVVGLVALLGVVAWVLGWLAVPGQVVSPENVRAQWRWAYDTEESLKAAAIQYCAAQDALDAAATDSEWIRQQRQTQVTFHQQNYARIAAEYDGRMRDAFRAGLVAPPDVRDRAPSLDEMVEEVCR